MNIIALDALKQIIKTFSKEGLYLLFDSGELIDLSLETIKEKVDTLLGPDSWLTPEQKEILHSDQCQSCPKRGKVPLCHAIYPTLAFISSFNRFSSYDSVIACSSQGKEHLSVKQTSMQDALKFISILSLMHYCELGATMRQYFFSINPLDTSSQIAAKVYLNFLQQYPDNQQKRHEAIRQFQKELKDTVENQLTRLRLVSTNDSLINAFVKTHVISDFLTIALANEKKET